MHASNIAYAIIPLLLTSLIPRAIAQASQPAELEKTGIILHIQGSHVFADLGAYDQLASGTPVELFEVISIKNPKTQTTVTSTFLIGEGSVRVLGARLCIIAVSEDLRRRLKVGDRIKPKRNGPAQQSIDPWIVKPPPPPRAMTQQEFELLVQLMDKTHGKPLSEQIRALEDWVFDNEASPVAKDVGQEIEWLRTLRKQEQAAQQQIAEQSAQHRKRLMSPLAARETEIVMSQPMAVRHPARAREAWNIHLAFTVLDPDAIREAWLYYRQAGVSQYQRRVLTEHGDAYRHGIIPAEVVRVPGVEYFVEASSTQGTPPKAVLGSLEHPRRIVIQEAADKPTSKEHGPRSQVSMRMDYVDFDGLSKGGDQYGQVEADIQYRFYRRLHAMRIGFGSLSGTSSSDRGMSYKADYAYLYAELEFPLSKMMAFMLRPQLGTVESRAEQVGSCEEVTGDNCQQSSAFGLRARLRIGQEDHTHLILGFDSAKSIGALYEFLFNWPVIPEWPVQFVAQVTDQPVAGDYGLRLIIDLGWRAIPWVYPSLRLSAQGRDVENSGISGGLGLNFIW